MDKADIKKAIQSTLQSKMFFYSKIAKKMQLEAKTKFFILLLMEFNK